VSCDIDEASGYGRADVRALDVVWALWQLTSVSECGLKGMLMLDAQSYAALQVFHEERHPSAMGLGKAKEGLSMYGVLNQCVSAPGRALLRLWLARPLVDLSAIIARQVSAHRGLRLC
jgi:DNA mismatch repair ATPase MutS